MSGEPGERERVAASQVDRPAMGPAVAREIGEQRRAGDAVHGTDFGRGVCRIDTSGMEWMEALCGSMGDFLLAIEERREPAVSGRRNLGTIEAVMAEMASVKSGGRWVDVSGRGIE